MLSSVNCGEDRLERSFCWRGQTGTLVLLERTDWNARSPPYSVLLERTDWNARIQFLQKSITTVVYYNDAMSNKAMFVELCEYAETMVESGLHPPTRRRSSPRLRGGLGITSFELEGFRFGCVVFPLLFRLFQLQTVDRNSFLHRVLHFQIIGEDQLMQAGGDEKPLLPNNRGGSACASCGPFVCSYHHLPILSSAPVRPTP